MIDDDLRTWLLNHAPLAAQIGDRLYPEARTPQAPASPYVTYAEIDTTLETDLQALDQSPVTRFQFRCWADGPHARARARAVADLLLQRVFDPPFRGWMGQTFVQHLRVENRQEVPEPPRDGAEVGPAGYQLDLLVCYEEPLPYTRP